MEALTFQPAGTTGTGKGPGVGLIVFVGVLGITSLLTWIDFKKNGRIWPYRLVARAKDIYQLNFKRDEKEADDLVNYANAGGLHMWRK
jgi:hypothetical protein